MKRGILPNTATALTAAGLLLLGSGPAEVYPETMLRSNGQVSFAPYLAGVTDNVERKPGYRSELFVYTDVIRSGRWTFSWLISNTTLIVRPPGAGFTLDKIRYTLSPSFRCEFKKWIATGLLLHECIHSISRPEANGLSTWWNALQLGAGTKGAYHWFLIDKYNTRDITLGNSLDAALTAGAYLRGNASRWIAQNHTYRADLSGLLRYHFPPAGHHAFFADIQYHAWLSDGGSATGKCALSLNAVFFGRDNIAALYWTQILRDRNPHDNEDGLGSLGIKIIF
ncbi:hypothetical protein JW777_04110 [bacterium]|nr:hypothetical protein [bacterium]